MTGKAGKPHYAGPYARHAATIRAHANNNPDTRCWRCGLTKQEYAAIHGPQAARWQAGHINDSQPGSPLAPEHARCNASAGAHNQVPHSKAFR